MPIFLSFVYHCRDYSRHLGNRCVFWGAFFYKKGICLLTPPKQTFSTISNENIFLNLRALNCTQ